MKYPKARPDLRDARSCAGENDEAMFAAVEVMYGDVTLFSVEGSKPILEGTRIWTDDVAPRTYALVPKPWVGEVADDEIEGGPDAPGSVFADRVVYYADGEVEGYLRASDFAAFIL